MRKQRTTRVRTMSDSELEHALVGALVDWLTSSGVFVPPARLTALWVAYRGRFLGHGDRCTCWECVEEPLGVEDLLELELGLVDDF